MPVDLGWNVVVHIVDDGDEMSMRSMPWVGELAGTQAGEAFTCVNGPNYVFDYSLCSPNRVTLFTGWRASRHGVTKHGNSPQDGSADPGAAVRMVAAGTPGYWRANTSKYDVLPRWMRRRGRTTALIGKHTNNYPWGDDTYTAGAWDRLYAALDDSDLGGAHSPSHNGAGYLGSAAATLTSHPMAFLNEDETIDLHNAGTDAITNVGYTDAAFAARGGPSDYVSDLYSRQFRRFITGVSGARMTEPFFAVMSHRGVHAEWLPATRHAASTVRVTGATGTVLATDGSTDPPGFNEPDATFLNKPAWTVADRPLMSGAEEMAARNDRILKARTVLAVDEAIYDAWQACRGLRPTVHIVVSDNGFALGHNRDKRGKVSPYKPSHVAPWYVLWPVGTGRRTESTLVTPADVTALVCAIAGAVPTRALDGRGELLKIIDGSWATGTALHSHVPFNYVASNEFIQPSFQGIHAADGKRAWRLSSYTDATKGGATFAGAVEAYDTATDPGETLNVGSSAPWVAGMLARMDGIA